MTSLLQPVDKMEDGLPMPIKSFISLVEERPVLWDKSLDDYKRKIATQNTWQEILMILYPNFDTWDKRKRQEYTKRITRKWTHIRDSFMKSEKKIESQKMFGGGARKTKPYLYRKQLLFLKKNMPNTLVASNDTLGTKSENTDEDSTSGSSTQNYDDNIQTERTNVRTRSLNLPQVETKMIELVDSYQTQTINRHLSFFNGLIPSLEQFNDDQIIDFQLGVITLIKNIKNRHNDTSTWHMDPLDKKD